MRSVASIQGKLKAYAKAKGKIHQNILVKFFQERLLFRLSKSSYRNNFLLKGGALAYSISEEESRHTKDIDLLLKRLSSETKFLVAVFAEIAIIDGDDGVVFAADTIKADTITKEGSYTGTRIKLEARLGNIKQWTQVDIGVGDYVTPGPREIVYPTILDELQAPNLIAYSIESLIAEKFNAMIDLGVFNSRMKDFYDVHKFIHLCDPSVLNVAISNTFRVRATKWAKDHPLFQDSFYADPDRLRQWELFLKKNHLTRTDFEDVKGRIVSVLMPIYLSLRNA
ncbi:MAG: nucleotidyl transferase AbiEii/AbiGii toxin family protein [Bacteroidota bacterium]